MQCVNQCLPDPGPRRMTQQMCDDAEQGLEFLPLPIWDMGTVTDSQGNKKNLATGMYFYDDKTASFRVPGSIWEPFTEVATSGVPSLPVDSQVVEGPPPNAVGRCGEPVSDPYSPNVHHAIHVVGGPFIEWGGGMGRMLKCMNTDNDGTTPTPWLASLNLNKYLCGARLTTIYSLDQSGASYAACKTATTTPDNRNDMQKTLIGVCPQRDLDYAKNSKPDDNDEPFMTGMALDVTDHVMHDPSGVDIPVRGWAGIAFWARRSPNSQEGIRLAVADKYVDDDMSYLSYKYDKNRPRHCERRTVCSCPNNKPCTAINVIDNQYDVEGNRLKWAAAGLTNTVRGNIAVDSNGRSLINMSGDVITDNGQARTFPDGSKVTAFEGWNGSGQPYETDVMPWVTRKFCFDPAVDAVPPDGTPYQQVVDRAYRNPWFTTFDPYRFTPCGQGFYCDTANSTLTTPPSSDPIQVPLPASNPGVTELPGYNYIPCGDTFCNEEYPSFQAVDPQSFGRTCNDFAFEGSITYGYCYTPGVDLNPAENSLACGDYWMNSVNLSTDWQLIKVPFSSLVQQGWAKRQYQFDLSNLTDVRLEWDRGWLDVWISDVRFYRTKQQ